MLLIVSSKYFCESMKIQDFTRFLDFNDIKRNSMETCRPIESYGRGEEAACGRLNTSWSAYKGV